MVIVRPRSTQTEEGQDRQDHHDEADKVDDAIHLNETPVTQLGHFKKARCRILVA
jgi:hypothetical protein